MLFTVLGAVVLGIAVGGLVLMAFKAFGRPVPRGAAALAGGAAMFGFVIWNDYSWYARTQAALPEGIDAVAAFTHSSPWAPWTLAAPATNRFAAVDRITLLRHPEATDLRVAEIHFLTRHRPTLTVRQAFDCAKATRAEAPDAAALDAIAAGAAAWTQLAANDPVLRAVCAEPPFET